MRQVAQRVGKLLPIALLCAVTSACAAPHAGQRSPSIEPAEGEAEPLKAPVDFVAVMESIAQDPRRLLERVNPSRGLAIARWLDCETDSPVKVLRHACGESIAGELDEFFRGLAEAIESGKHDEAATGPWVRCRSGLQPECEVPGIGECFPHYKIVFAAETEASVVAVVERNDWIPPSEPSPEVDRRVKELIARSASGCPGKGADGTDGADGGREAGTSRERGGRGSE